MVKIARDNQPSPANAKHHWYSGFIVNYGSYAMAGVATILSSVENINRYFHKNFYEETENSGLSIADKKSQYDEVASIAGNDGLLLAKKRRDLHKYFHNLEKVADRHLGVRNQGVSGFFLAPFDKFKNIKPHQKIEVGLKMATVGALTIGAIFTINRNKSLSAKVEYHEKTKDEAVQERAERQAIADAQAGRLPGTEKIARLAAGSHILKAEPKHFSAVDELSARVQQQARGQEPAMAQRG